MDTTTTSEDAFSTLIEKISNHIAQTTGGTLWGTILAAIIIVVAAAIVSHVLCKLIRHGIEKRESTLPATIFVNICRVVIWTIALCVLFSTCLKINLTSIIAALGVGGIAVSLGMQDTVSNVIGGLQMSLMRICKIGDHVIIDGSEGIIKDIAWRQTVVQGFAGEEFIIPNKLINSNSVTILPPIRKIKVNIQIPYETVALYGDDEVGMDKLAAEMGRSVVERLSNPKPDGLGLKLSSDATILFRDATDFAVTTQAIVWIDEGEQFDRVVVEDAVVRSLMSVSPKGHMV